MRARDRLLGDLARPTTSCTDVDADVGRRRRRPRSASASLHLRLHVLAAGRRPGPGGCRRCSTVRSWILAPSLPDAVVVEHRARVVDGDVWPAGTSHGHAALEVDAEVEAAGGQRRCTLMTISTTGDGRARCARRPKKSIGGLAVVRGGPSALLGDASTGRQLAGHGGLEVGLLDGGVACSCHASAGVLEAERVAPRRASRCRASRTTAGRVKK